MPVFCQYGGSVRVVCLCRYMYVRCGVPSVHGMGAVRRTICQCGFGVHSDLSIDSCIDRRTYPPPALFRLRCQYKTVGIRRYQPVRRYCALGVCTSRIDPPYRRNTVVVRTIYTGWRCPAVGGRTTHSPHASPVSFSPPHQGQLPLLAR
jgi:hypothetical protein